MKSPDLEEELWKAIPRTSKVDRFQDHSFTTEGFQFLRVKDFNEHEDSEKTIDLALTEDVSLLPRETQFALKMLELELASFVGYEVVLQNAVPF
jgi:hypothetical protein